MDFFLGESSGCRLLGLPMTKSGVDLVSRSVLVPLTERESTQPFSGHRAEVCPPTQEDPTSLGENTSKDHLESAAMVVHRPPGFLSTPLSHVGQVWRSPRATV